MAKKGIAPWKIIALVAVVAAPVILFAGGCDPECVDNFDCKRSVGADYVCKTGKCVKGPPDAGTSDAGM